MAQDFAQRRPSAMPAAAWTLPGMAEQFAINLTPSAHEGDAVGDLLRAFGCPLAIRDRSI
jgi:hypothetical protein